MKSKLFGAALLALIAVPAQQAAAQTNTIGNAAVERDSVDACAPCTFVLDEAFGQAGLTLSSYTFFAGAENDITPLLLTGDGSTGEFTVVGVGTTRLGALGVNTFDFGLTAGTALTTASSYFGFSYAAGGGGNTVAFNFGLDSPSIDDTRWPGSGSYDSLGNTFLAGPLGRSYSINATAVGPAGAVPEPATWAMMIIGFGAVGASMRRRTRVRIAQALA